MSPYLPSLSSSVNVICCRSLAPSTYLVPLGSLFFFDAHIVPEGLQKWASYLPNLWVVLGRTIKKLLVKVLGEYHLETPILY